MGEVLKSWFRDRLGIMIDLNPDEFGATTKDGTLLAELLHSYGIIDKGQLETIINTEDPTLARVNLRLLRLWLKFIGVDCDDDTIEDVSEGKGTTAIRLFYKIFVNLESKDKLHFITQQKEREKYIPNSFKFDVTIVQEKTTIAESAPNSLAKKLTKNWDVVAWHRNDKFKKILERCKFARKNNDDEETRNFFADDETVMRINENDFNRRLKIIRDNENKELNDFGDKYVNSLDKFYTYKDLCDERRKCNENLRDKFEDENAAEDFLKSVKERKRRNSAIRNDKNRIEISLTNKLWEKEISDKEKEFDAEICGKLFNQSQYEKQMIEKLCEIKDQKRRFAKNRGIVDKLLREQTEVEHDMELARERENLVKQNLDIEGECLRICELQRRIKERKNIESAKKRFDICSLIIDDIIDIALAAASYRKTNEDFIPTRIWNEWKILFLKNERIYSNPEENDDDEEEEEEEIHLKMEKERREEILSESELDNYLRLDSPWAEFVPEIDSKTREILRLGEIVLGRIVHRLLFEFSRSFSESKPQINPVPKFTPACILLGLFLDKSAYSVLQTLLNHRRIKILRVEDGVNYCLQCYKEEAITAIGERKWETGIEGRDNFGVDEETQTPRSFPEDGKNPLSNSAQIGKTIDELFAVGKPIPEILNPRIIVEYAKSCFNEFKGWVLIDYPNTFNQMAMLEAALTGAKIPMEMEDSSSGEKTIANFGAVDGESRLVFNPFGKGDTGRENFDLCITAFIRAFPIAKDMFFIRGAKSNEDVMMSEILAPDASTIDYFYADRGIAFEFYYSSLDLRSLKKLCRIIIGGDFSSPSIEAFGDLRGFDFPLDLKDDQRDDDSEKFSEASVVKRLLPALGNFEDDKGGEKIEYEYENGSRENFAENLIFEIGDYNRDPIPGDDDWNWFDLPHEFPGVLAALGNIWKNMEEIYVDKLKALFSTKRFIHAQILPYRNRLAEHMKDLIETPSDIKQTIVSNFQKSFNDIGEDVRDDIDAKCELHCRVNDFREQLYRVSDQRKIFADLERQRIIREDWIAEQIVLIVNVYLAIIEAEIHRCVDTVQIIHDYYTSMLKRNEMTENRYEKYYINRLRLRNPMIETSVSIPQRKISKEAVSSSSRKGAKNSTFKNNDRDREAPSSVDFSLVKKQIEESLLDAKDDDLFDPDSTIYCQIISDNVLFGEKTIENLSISVLEILQKEESSLFNKKAKNSEDDYDIFIRGYREWKSVLEFEKKRAIMRLKILANSGKSEVDFIFQTVKKCLDKTRREIEDRYKREVKTVDDIAKLFSLAIEESLPVREEVLFDGDGFLLRTIVSEDPLPGKKRIKEPIKTSRFQIRQLVRLMDIFRFLAPNGSIAERVFVYIIEDIVAFDDGNGGEESSKNLLPDNWYKIPKEGDKIGQIIGELFCNRDYIDWRDFLIYAMEIKMPSEDEILEMRSRFAALDTNFRHNVTREQFRETKIYFSNNDSIAFAKIKDDFLREDNFQRLDEEDFSHSREKCVNFLHGSLCGDIANNCFDEDSSADSNVDFIANQETARLLMAKELLCEIFASGCDSVCYTGFLLAFCKDEDPRIGFGKALALIVGKKVCTSIVDGELYVEELTRNRESEIAGKQTIARMIKKEDEREGIFSNTSSFSTNTTNDELSSSSNRDLIKFNEGSIDTKNQAKNGEKNVENIFEIKFDEYDNLSKDNSSSGTTISAIDEITRNLEKQPTTILSSSLDSKIAHWIPIDVCLTVLISSLPWHVTRHPDVSDTRSCLRECLKKVYADLFDIDLNGDEKSALSHRLINHCFIVNMIDSTTAFKAKNIADILEKYLKRWDDDELFNS